MLNYKHFLKFHWNWGWSDRAATEQTTAAFLWKGASKKKMAHLFLCIGNQHWILLVYLQTLKPLHSNCRLHLIPILHKGNPWLCFHHSNFLKTWVLAEKHLQHHRCCLMGKILNEEYAIWRSRSFRNCRFCTTQIWYLRQLNHLTEIERDSEHLSNGI